MKVRKHTLLLIGIASFFIIMAHGDIKALFTKNIAYLYLSKAFTPEPIKATVRQEMLGDFVRWYQLSQNRTYMLPWSNETSKMLMLRSIFIGQYYRFQGDMESAVSWYLMATNSTPFPVWQSSLTDIWQNKLSKDGNVMLDDFEGVGGWIPHTNHNNSEATIESRDGIAIISYPNHLEQRDVVAYVLYPGDLRLGYHTVLSVRVKIETGSLLTIDVKVDDGLERVLSYYPGTGDWETLQFHLTSEMFYVIYLNISEPWPPPTEIPVYKVWIDWIHFDLALD